MNQNSIPNNLALARLQNELGLFIREEHAARRDALRRHWARPVHERVLDGRCIDQVSVVGPGPAGVWRLRCFENDSRFREGDIVGISRGDPSQPLLRALMAFVGDTELEVKPWGSDSSGILENCRDGLCIDETALDLEKFYQDALAELGGTDHGRECILPLLTGRLRPLLDAAEVAEAMEEAGQKGFDDVQAEAIANACATDHCWLIHGPPGTGKTRVIGQIAARLLAQGERVLITSFTHRAINNALETIADTIGDKPLLARVAPYVDRSLSVPQFEDFTATPFANSAGGYIIGATPFALRSRRLRGVDFDTVIVDEASQVTIPLAIMAMLAGKRFIFAGDQHQLPPVSQTLAVREAVKMSIFGRLVDRGFDTMLQVTHRLNDQLCRWPSDAFYQSRLSSHPSIAGRRLRSSLVPQEFIEALSPEPSVVWMAVPHCGARTAAVEEVTLVSDLLLALVAGGTRWKDIGVVVPYRRQARLLRRHLAQKVRNRHEISELVVDTVERMQGQEREVIVLSFATSDHEFAARLRAFLFEPQRLNVAATRSLSKLLIVASPELLMFAQSQHDDHGAACFVDLLQSARRIDVPLDEPTDESAT